MKNARQQLDIVNAYRQLGSYRAAPAVCGTSHKTVKRVVERTERGLPLTRHPRTVVRNTDPVREVITEKVRASRGRISAKRLLPVVRAAGYRGSGRNLRRAVAEEKIAYRRGSRRYRPWLPTPGEYLVIDWTVVGGLHMFGAVLAWSRWRFVRFARNERLETTQALLAECLEELGGVPAVVLADRMACLRAGIVANRVVSHPDYVRFATYWGFRPDFCEAHDPESKGLVENLMGYAQNDLVVPAGELESVEEANRAARLWCLEVNGKVHSEIQALPERRLQEERELLRPLPSLRPPLRRGEPRKADKLQTIRFGSARYSVPSHLVGHTVEVTAQDDQVLIYAGEREIARHPLMPPGEASILDEHYEGPARRPSRPVRARTQTERAFLALGREAETFLRAAAAAGTPRLAAELADLVLLEASWGRSQLASALERASSFRRFRAQDVRAILEAGAGLPTPATAGAPLALALPEAPVRPLSEYALEAVR